MKVTSLNILPAAVPFTCHFGTPYPARSQVLALAIFLGTDSGPRGEGLLVLTHGKGLRVLHEMVLSLEPLIVGIELSDRQAFMRRAKHEARHIGYAGVAAIAIGAVEGALLDLAAKAACLPMHRFLGARQTAVRAYYSSGFWPQVPLDEMILTAERVIAAGYRAIKVRVGALSLEEDEHRLAALRSSVGPDIRIMVDAGRRLQVEAAIRLGEMLSPHALTWFEEPVAGDDHEVNARIASALKTPVALGESVFSREEFAEIMQKRAAGIIMPDLQRIGGPSGFLDIAAMARVNGLEISSHVAPEMTLPLMAHVENPGYLEIMPWAAPFYKGGVTVEDGYAVPAEVPGWGLSLCEQTLARHALN